MAKKQTATGEQPKRVRAGKAVRLDLADDDFDRLDRVAKRMGLTKASYARMVVLKAIRGDDVAVEKP